MGHEERREDGKKFIRRYTIALKFWDEFNANFVFVIFFKLWVNKNLAPLLQKCKEKSNKVVH